MRRVLKKHGELVAIALVLFGVTACSTNPRQCASQTDCFGGEQCVAGECVAVAPTPDTGPTPDVSEPPIDCRLDESRCGDRVCNVSTGDCEACQRDLQCGDGGICDKLRGVCTCGPGFHACGGQCVRSDSPLTCGGACEPCPQAPDATATCSAGSCGFACDDGFRPCDGCDFDVACIECASNSECNDPAQPFCSEGRCGSCGTDADCSHLDTAVCDRGECVECGPGNVGACGNFSCDFAKRECTTTPLQDLDWCDACVADSECPPNHRCVPMNFKSAPRPGGYCLEEANLGCSGPATIQVQRDSLSGVPDEHYCTIREDLTTCEAHTAFNHNCTQETDCGAPGLGDAYCKGIQGRDVCTYPCTTREECVGQATCLGNPPNASYCAIINL